MDGGDGLMFILKNARLILLWAVVVGGGGGGGGGSWELCVQCVGEVVMSRSTQ